MRTVIYTLAIMLLGSTSTLLGEAATPSAAGRGVGTKLDPAPRPGLPHPIDPAPGAPPPGFPPPGIPGSGGNRGGTGGRSGTGGSIAGGAGSGGLPGLS